MITFPNCKINIGLHITEKRADGFHELETVLLPVNWEDIMEIVPNENGDVEFKSTGIRIYGEKENNLCIKAYRLLAREHNLPPVKIHLHKIIPIGAGLGGGSADAAFALSMLNKMFALKIPEQRLEELAAMLGSDCPVFIRNKPVYATGKGDVFEKINLRLKGCFLIIVKPRIHVNTAEAYSWIKPLKREQSLKQLLQLPVERWRETISNDFELSVFEKYPTIRNIKQRLYKLGAVYASMSGSGSSVYGIFNEEKHLNTYFRSSTVWAGEIKL